MFSFIINLSDKEIIIVEYAYAILIFSELIYLFFEKVL